MARGMTTKRDRCRTPTGSETHRTFGRASDTKIGFLRAMSVDCRSKLAFEPAREFLQLQLLFLPLLVRPLLGTLNR